MVVEKLLKPMIAGTSPRPIDYLPGEFVDQADAIEAIERFIERYHHSGFNPEENWWWCRNIDDTELTILIIR